MGIIDLQIAKKGSVMYFDKRMLCMQNVNG